MRTTDTLTVDLRRLERANAPPICRGKLAKVFPRCVEVDGLGLLGGGEVSKRDGFVIYDDASVVRAKWAALVVDVALTANGFCAIPRIFRVRCLAQIRNRIVASVAIDVIDEVRGPAPIDVEPGKSMGLKNLSVDAQPNVVVRVTTRAEGLPYRFRRTRSGLGVGKDACQFVITNNLSQAFLREMADEEVAMRGLARHTLPRPSKELQEIIHAWTLQRPHVIEKQIEDAEEEDQRERRTDTHEERNRSRVAHGERSVVVVMNDWIAARSRKRFE